MKKFLLRYLIIPFLFSCLLVISTPLKVSAQYLHVDGKKIVDKNGSEVILRGMGLGGWMLQEGYMLETNAFANPQHEIRAKIKELIGETDTQEFYDAWLANHCTRRDVDSLASWGFNSIRLPMHYNLYTLPIEQEPVAGENTWLDKGFAMTDSLLKWCEANHMYLILDLHAAPGGQGHDAAISDYDATKPSLWESEANKQKTIALWKKLAERYATKEWIGAYDLINEPNWNFVAGQNANGCDETGNAPLRKLYV
ncbi:MAG TPA: cellulase family glycosylhydrolase, partial [Chryseolinea sp.]|nr:cellulase family glycosylhydrolase [Chryseolinea sp.]